MKAKLVLRALLKAKCTEEAGAKHGKWVCPCGQHSANIPRHGTISPGVVGDTIKRMTSCRKGGCSESAH